MSATTNRLSGCLDVPFWLSVLSGEKRGAGYGALRQFLALAAGCYSTGLAIYLTAERVGLRRRASLPVPVISVGNITSGGTGKTPFTQIIADELLRLNLRPAILSRGHGGRLSRGIAQVSDAGGKLLLGAADAGDEAVALAKLTPGVPVFIGKDRVASARSALELCKPGLFLLDDGMQYWQLKRDLDIVLIDSRAPFDNGYPLPRGTLREPKRNLSRAGIIVITRSNLIAETELQALKTQLAQLAPGVPVFRASHSVSGLTPLNHAAAIADKRPLRPLTACGIAQPAAFLASLQASGVPASGERFVALQDHASFGRDDLELLYAAIAETGCDGVIVTGKDAVKFDPEQFDVPAYAADLRVEVQDAGAFWEQLWKMAGLSGVQPARPK